MQPTTQSLWLASLHIPDVGQRTMQRLITQCGSIENLFQSDQKTLATLGLNNQQIQAILKPNWHEVERAIRWAEVDNHFIIDKQDKRYPALLKEIPDAPELLFIAGNPDTLSLPQIAIVGARNASPIGLQNAEHFAYYLAQSGFIVTSGLALGIDGASHRGALKAQGVTIAVTGAGLNHLYPKSHYQLAQDIVSKNGALLSEFPLEMPPIASNFPRRNRIISALSLGVLVVEAAVKSGSMITVKFALEQGREVFAIPGSIHHPLARGCHHLIRQGAKLVEEAQHIVEELSSLMRGMQLLPATPDPTINKQKFEKITISPEQNAILSLIGYEMTPLDMILCRSGLTASQVSSILLRLELDGYIESIAGGYIRLA